MPSSSASTLRLFAGLSACALAFACGSPRPTNVLLVSIDTLRADEVPEMPYLAARGREGLSFPRVYAASNWTLPSHASLLLSQPFSEHHVPNLFVRPPYLEAQLPPATLLSEAFAAGGYRTFGSFEGGYLNPKFGFARGFEKVSLVPAISHRPDADIDDHVRALEKFVAAAGPKPIFAFVHTYRAHDYFLNLPQFQAGTSDEEAEWRSRGSLLPLLFKWDGSAPPSDYLRLLYRNAAREADSFLQRLVSAATAADPARSWVVAVTSDHGEGFDADPGRRGHGTALVEEQLRVPWIVWNAGAPADRPLPKAASALASGIDVAPSLLARAGLPVPPTFRGRADLLLGASGSERGEIEVGFVDNNDPLQEHPELALLSATSAVLRRGPALDAAPPLCFALASESRPGIAEWVVSPGGCDASTREVTRRLHGWITADAAAERTKAPAAPRDPASQKLLDELSALGYL